MGIGVSIRQAELLRQGARRSHDDQEEARERKPAPGAAGWPEPLIPMRDAVSAEMPSSPRANALLAKRRGWLVRTTYAAGTSMTRYGEPGRLIESIAVRCARMDEDELTRVVMIWHRPWDQADAAYKFVSALIWGTHERLRKTKLQDARDVLESRGSADESAIIDQDVTDQDEREGEHDGTGHH